MSVDTASPVGFRAFALSAPVFKALDDVGYEAPSPIQAQIIPHVLAGKDVVGQAQTGTGKTAAFALPLLSRLDLQRLEPQILVLTPTRELAIQEAAAFERYGAHLRGLRVLSIYGGQDYRNQLRQLKRGVHVVVGTPGRVIDHMHRGTLLLTGLSCLVLDEADEMLRMGFIDDVEWIMQQTPAGRQVALFSATIPQAIRDIAQRHLHDPAEVTIRVRTTTVETLHQRYLVVRDGDKLEALTNILEAEAFAGMLVFVRTKTATVTLAEQLVAHGFAAAPLHGDMTQPQRERTVERFKAGQLDILVATDVAARGLDIERISHVVNYDVPFDTDAYVHRVGRTGRAGRRGEAILFVTPQEKRLLYAIEKATRQKITLMQLPTTEAMNHQRIARFTRRITDTLTAADLPVFRQVVGQYQQEHQVPALDIAAALAKLVQGDRPLLLASRPTSTSPAADDKPHQAKGDIKRRTVARPEAKGDINRRTVARPDIAMERFRIEVGHDHGVKPGNIVGAIANEAGLDHDYIGRIDIAMAHSTVELPQGMPSDIFRRLQKVRVAGQQLKISRLNGPGQPHLATKGKPGQPKRPQRRTPQAADVGSA
jgi:ATP-dependent RNA helicase DeaD